MQDALHDLVLFVQFKTREKHPWGSVNFVLISSGRLENESLLSVPHAF